MTSGDSSSSGIIGVGATPGIGAISGSSRATLGCCGATPGAGDTAGQPGPAARPAQVPADRR